MMPLCTINRKRFDMILFSLKGLKCELCHYNYHKRCVFKIPNDCRKRPDSTTLSDSLSISSAGSTNNIGKVFQLWKWLDNYFCQSLSTSKYFFPFLSKSYIQCFYFLGSPLIHPGNASPITPKKSGNIHGKLLLPPRLQDWDLSLKLMVQ